MLSQAQAAGALEAVPVGEAEAVSDVVEVVVHGPNRQPQATVVAHAVVVHRYHSESKATMPAIMTLTWPQGGQPELFRFAHQRILKLIVAACSEHQMTIAQQIALPLSLVLAPPVPGLAGLLTVWCLVRQGQALRLFQLFQQPDCWQLCMVSRCCGLIL